MSCEFEEVQSLDFEFRDICRSCLRFYHAAVGVNFFIIAIIAGLLGFSQIVGTATWIAQVLFVVFLILAIVSLLTGRKPVM